MDNSTQHTELLIRYLDGELSAEEKNILEQRLKQQSELQEELESLQLARQAIHSYGLKTRVKEIGAGMEKKFRAPVRTMSPGRKFARYTLAVAASLLIVLIGVLGYNFYTLSPVKIFASNYRSYEVTTLRDGGDNASAIEKAYRQKDYRTVADLSKTGKLSAKDQFLAAAALTELKDYTGAIDNYKKVLATNQATGADIMMAETEYYLSLAYMRNKDYDQALELMNKIHDDPAHPYHERITDKLIRKVKMLKWR